MMIMNRISSVLDSYSKTSSKTLALLLYISCSCSALRILGIKLVIVTVFCDLQPKNDTVTEMPLEFVLRAFFELVMGITLPSV